MPDQIVEEEDYSLKYYSIGDDIFGFTTGAIPDDAVLSTVEQYESRIAEQEAFMDSMINGEV